MKWKIAYDEREGVYALLPDDGTRGIVIGDLAEMGQLITRLARFSKDRLPDETICPYHRQLGWEWMTAAVASRQHGIPLTTIRSACQDGRIQFAEHDERGDWSFPAITFNTWLRHYRMETRGKR
jgi:hypothetical protein